ncbi:DUF4328 domain-containing protein [Kitasatospora sp. NPDC088346]|uniref:DUF4328 domain-containing protein n=1 Tax=Kitasatospora sp. NPDC088346 TaxID=3364073 RepID=UPI0038059AFC
MAVYALLALNAALAAMVVAIDLWCDMLLGRALDGADDVGFDELDAMESVVNAVDGAALPLGLVTAVVFIVWLYRIRRNAELLLPNGHRLGRGWTIGAWFTPIVQFWFPWRLIVDCWRASAPLDAEGRRRTTSEKAIGLWWSTWIASLIVTRIANGRMRDVNPYVLSYLESLRSSIRMEATGSALRVAAAVAAIIVVNRLTTMQQTRRADVNPFAARAAQEARVQALVSAPAAVPVAPAAAGVPHEAAPEVRPSA